ncbi:MAG: flagellar motor switch protein FliN, partial [Sphingomonadales bacterium]
MSNDLNLPDLSAGGGVAQPRNATNEVQEDMRERMAADLRPVFDVPVNVQAVIGRTTIEVAKL